MPSVQIQGQRIIQQGLIRVANVPSTGLLVNIPQVRAVWSWWGMYPAAGGPHPPPSPRWSQVSRLAWHDPASCPLKAWQGFGRLRGIGRVGSLGPLGVRVKGPGLRSDLLPSRVGGCREGVGWGGFMQHGECHRLLGVT